jgi:pSer/pThr/pTyr-binding forkhead associated (FHA) protein
MSVPVNLVIVSGKPAGKTLKLPRGEYMIGRGPECQLRPNSEWVSRQHCLLIVEDQEVRVRDLGSTNGTLINGQRIRDEIPLQSGDLMQLGSVALRLVFDGDLDKYPPPEIATSPGKGSGHGLDTTPPNEGKTVEFDLPEAPPA